MAIPGEAFLGPAAHVIGGLIGAGSSGNLNKKNRRHQIEMLKMQQAYNDKVNQEQMAFQKEWNDPSNIRSRLEKAGYNPYLVGKEDLGSVSSSGLNSLGASLNSPTQYDPGQSLSAGISGAASSFYDSLSAQKDIDGKELDNDFFRYNFQKQIENDNLKKDGVSAYYHGGLIAISQIETAQANATIQAIQSTFQQWQKDFYSRNALDEYGKPLTDENGAYVDNYTAEKRSNVTRSILAVQKLQQDMLAGKANIENMKIDALIKRYDLQFMKPQELENLKQSLAVMQSTITANNASAQASLANAYNQMMQGQTTNAIRPYQVGAASWDAHSKKFQGLTHELSYYDEKGEYDYKDWERKFKSSPINKFVYGLSNTAASFIPGFGPFVRFFKK